MKTDIIVMGANGRMGKSICQLAVADPDCTLAGLVDNREHLGKLEGFGCPVADSLSAVLPAANAVVIDFTAPAVSLQSARTVSATGNALVIGTTGFSPEEKQELESLAGAAPIFWASNMSIGVNVLQQILPALVQALGPGYDMEMVELHHNRKKDSPSGTALTLGECLAKARNWDLGEVRCSARDGMIGERPERQIGIQAVRGGDVVGVHTIYFMGPGERIEITHHAHSRENFAQGALRAAKWLSGQKGGRLYGMKDIFQA